jgi:glycyl-tRNA synthetase beta subunit
MSTDLTDAQRNQIIETIHRGAKIEAIKLYMEATGVGLKESKDAVEAIEAGLEPRPAGSKDPFAKKAGCFGVLAMLVAMALIAANCL